MSTGNAARSEVARSSSRRPGRTTRVLFCFSMCTLAAAWLLYGLQPDGAAALTILPPVIWFGLGLLITVPTLRWRRGCLVAFAFWLGFGVTFVEPMRASLRPGFRVSGAARAAPHALRIACLNCASSPAAAREGARFCPDVLLLQETPTPREAERIASDLFGAGGGTLCGLDASILSNGPLTPIQPPGRVQNFVMARASVRGHRLTLVSLRLQPPVGRADFWSRTTREAQARSRRERRRELGDIMAFVRPRAAGLPIIVGGDFNAVARDPALSPVRNLIDSFDAAGRGWCDTAPNELPFARIDRVYASAGLRVLASTAIKTQHSDHRMLIVDVAAAREQR